MSSREKIVAALKKNQPGAHALPELTLRTPASFDHHHFKQVLTGIGGIVVEVANWHQIANHIKSTFAASSEIVNTIAELAPDLNDFKPRPSPHAFQNVMVTVMEGDFGVAENGAIWITNARMGDQALPYISEHLVLILKKNSIVPTLHDAYERIGNSRYRLGTFLAGPSKTADIEQSLVLGAHGSRSLTVFLLE